MTEQQQLEYDKWLNIGEPFKDDHRYQEFLKKIILSNCPVILSLKHLAVLLDVDYTILLAMINHSSSFYYEFSIPKRSGGERKISAPYPVMLMAQRWVNDNILSKVSIHSSATGFVRNASIKDNAIPHLGHDYILKADIKDFFPSIAINRIRLIFKRLGYSRKISFALASLCCLDGVLPQGAATSPIISNIIFKRLDSRMSGLASKFGLIYTRYADDLAFSGESLYPKFIEYVSDIVRAEGFELNAKKTKLMSPKHQQIITGISVSTGSIKLPKATKRKLRQEVYYVLKYGVREHLKVQGFFDPIYLERLIGKMYFWQSLEPDNKFVIDNLPKLKACHW